MLIHTQAVSYVIFVNVADILHRLSSDPLGGNNLNITKPDIGIKPRLTGLLTEL